MRSKILEEHEVCQEAQPQQASDWEESSQEISAIYSGLQIIPIQMFVMCLSVLMSTSTNNIDKNNKDWYP